MKTFILTMCFTVLSVTAHCQKIKEIKGNENIITTTRATSEYDQLEISGSFDVKLIAGKEGNITIKGDENIISYLKTEVKNDVLEIKMEKNTRIKYNYKSSLEITIPFTKIDKITFTGSGNLKNEDKISNNTFQFVMEGSGNVNFVAEFKTLKIIKSGSGNLFVKGTASSVDVTTSGSGNANLFDLKSENANANLSGSGNINIYCNNSLQANTSGSGTINYKGNPENVNKNSVGSGGVFPK